MTLPAERDPFSLQIGAPGGGPYYRFGPRDDKGLKSALQVTYTKGLRGVGGLSANVGLEFLSDPAPQDFHHVAYVQNIRGVSWTKEKRWGGIVLGVGFNKRNKNENYAPEIVPYSAFLQMGFSIPDYDSVTPITIDGAVLAVMTLAGLQVGTRKYFQFDLRGANSVAIRYKAPQQNMTAEAILNDIVDTFKDEDGNGYTWLFDQGRFINIATFTTEIGAGEGVATLILQNLGYSNPCPIALIDLDDDAQCDIDPYIAPEGKVEARRPNKIIVADSIPTALAAAAGDPIPKEFDYAFAADSLQDRIGPIDPHTTRMVSGEFRPTGGSPIPVTFREEPLGENEDFTAYGGSETAVLDWKTRFVFFKTSIADFAGGTIAEGFFHTVENQEFGYAVAPTSMSAEQTGVLGKLGCGDGSLPQLVIAPEVASPDNSLAQPLADALLAGPPPRFRSITFSTLERGVEPGQQTVVNYTKMNIDHESIMITQVEASPVTDPKIRARGQLELYKVTAEPWRKPTPGEILRRRFERDREIGKPRPIAVGPPPASDCTISTLAGTGTGGLSGDGGPATSAQMNQPNGIACDSNDDVYFCDNSNNRIRWIDVSTGDIDTYAGTTGGFSGDGGPATSAQLSNPVWVCFDASDNLYICDKNNNRIRIVDRATGDIDTIVGDGSTTYAGDGSEALLTGISPDGIIVIGTNLYIASQSANKVFVVDLAAGPPTITTFAGTGVAGFSGDGGAATSAQLENPIGLGRDTFGANLYILDLGDGFFPHLRVVNLVSGQIDSIDIGGALVTSDVKLSPIDNSIYVPTPGSGTTHQIWRGTQAGGDFAPHVGEGTAGFSGDGGDAMVAQLNAPFGVAIDSAGILYIACEGNDRIRKVVCPAPPAAPTCTELTGMGVVTPNPLTGDCYNSSGNVQLTVSNDEGQVAPIVQDSGDGTGSCIIDLTNPDLAGHTILIDVLTTYQLGAFLTAPQIAANPDLADVSVLAEINGTEVHSATHTFTGSEMGSGGSSYDLSDTLDLTALGYLGRIVTIKFTFSGELLAYALDPDNAITAEINCSGHVPISCEG